MCSPAYSHRVECPRLHAEGVPHAFDSHLSFLQNSVEELIMLDIGYKLNPVPTAHDEVPTDVLAPDSGVGTLKKCQYPLA